MTTLRNPRGFHTVAPYLLCKRAARVIDFLKGAFDAEEIDRITGPRGIILHAVLRLGASKIMLAEPDKSMPRLVAMPSHHYVFVSDIQATYERALASGGKSFSKPIGRRLGAVTDPGGNFWWIALPELASPAVLRRRNAAYLKRQARG
jgi:uncharacterized glyoxalase superfamily protein PhnB